MVWRAGWYSSAPGLNLPYFPLTLFFFLTPFLQSSLLISAALGYLLGWAGRGTCSNPRGKQISLHWAGEWGQAGEY